MFNTVSMAGAGAVITLIETVLRLLGVDFPEGSVAAAVNGIVAAAGLVFIVWGQIRRSDLHWGIVRK